MFPLIPGENRNCGLEFGNQCYPGEYVLSTKLQVNVRSQLKVQNDGQLRTQEAFSIWPGGSCFWLRMFGESHQVSARLEAYL